MLQLPGRKSKKLENPNILQSPELHVATSCDSSALKDMKECACVCMYTCVWVCVCAQVCVCMHVQCVVCVRLHMCGVCVCCVITSSLSETRPHDSISNLVWFSSPFFPPQAGTYRGPGEEKGNYAQWVKSKLSSFCRMAVGPPRDIRGQKPSFSHKMYFQPQGGRGMRWLGLLRQQPFLKNHFEIKLNDIKLAKVPGEPGSHSDKWPRLGILKSWRRQMPGLQQTPVSRLSPRPWVRVVCGAFTEAQSRAHTPREPSSAGLAEWGFVS